MELSIIVPVFNEEKTLPAILDWLIALPADKEIIVVDDASGDGSGAILQRYAGTGRIVLLRHGENQGKGAAIVTGLAAAHGEYTVIQDADLEYDPDDILVMLAEAKRHHAPAVFGSRVRNIASGISYRRYYWGGRFLTFLANLLYRVNISDESTCYKMVRTDLMKSLGLTCRRFEFCPELVAKLGRRKIPIREIPIRYHPRKMEEGKKIRWHDGAEAIWTLLRYRLGAK
ncbi:MAG: glycosyltransferase family 2 protein [candidate division Zixibacteria bacterium]|nr:glycosyltransferase family 2 protein [candidate division Zixibacteria bacterium]